MCFRKFPVAKKIMDKTGGEGIKIFCRKYFVSQFRKVLQGYPSVFHRFGVSKNVRDERREFGDLRFSVEVVFVSKFSNIS